jgi:hypothetical protein
MVFANLEDKYRNYAKSRKNNYNSGLKWSAYEIEKALDHSIPDKELAALLGRSVQAIHVKRSKINAVSEGK